MYRRPLSLPRLAPQNSPLSVVKARTRRLLSIGHSYVVGGNRQLAHAIQRVSRGRWEIQVAAPNYFHGGKDLRPISFSPAPRELCPVNTVPTYLTRFVHLFAYGWWNLRNIMRQNWDVVHAWEEPYILAGAELAACAPRTSRYVFRTAQSLDKWYPPPFNFFERYVVNRAAGWICSGAKVPEVLLGRPGYAKKPHRIIPLGVDVEAFRPNRPAGSVVRRSLGWSEPGPPVVGYLGRFVPEKGAPLLMRALDAVRTPWRALFIGTGPLEEQLRRWAERHPDRVRICTSATHDQVPGYLCAMDVLAAPSQTTPRWREQFGRMLIEAMACGVPVVGSDSGEIPHVLAGCGVVVPEKDESAWTRTLGELLENPSRRGELSTGGELAAREYYSWDEVGRQYLAFFDELLDAPAAAATR
jgi:glycosyltransferase involved in cell wall biosynthesis